MYNNRRFILNRTTKLIIHESYYSAMLVVIKTTCTVDICVIPIHLKENIKNHLESVLAISNVLFNMSIRTLIYNSITTRYYILARTICFFLPCFLSSCPFTGSKPNPRFLYCSFYNFFDEAIVLQNIGCLIFFRYNKIHFALKKNLREPLREKIEKWISSARVLRD